MALGWFCFLILDGVEPIDELGRVFCLTLYIGIGAITGSVAAYFARLIFRRNATFFNIAAWLLPAYFFLALLAVDKNLFGLAIVTGSVLIILLTMTLAARSVSSAWQAAGDLLGWYLRAGEGGNMSFWAKRRISMAIVGDPSVAEPPSARQSCCAAMAASMMYA